MKWVLQTNVVILLNGGMTATQKQKATQEIRTEKVMEAVEWLIENNVRWKGISLNEVRREIEELRPVIVDRSHEVETENANIEEKELFECYFPDGTTNETNGGFKTPDDFKTRVDEMYQMGFKAEWKLRLEQSFVNESDGDLLVNSSLLQFPYGRCGIDDKRIIGDEDEKSDIHLTIPYMRHFSKLSQPVFQEDMFQLMMYSIKSKITLFKKSRLQLRNKQTAEAIASGISAIEVETVGRARRNRDYATGSFASRKLLKAVNACTKALPHTNEAAMNARGIGESLQHYYGNGNIFLTVTFDDENSFLMQALCCKQIDGDEDLSAITDDELAARAGARKELRIRYPGMSECHFEMLYHIVMEEVVGWDVRRNRPTDHIGLFGRVIAVSGAIEEQKRKTIHVHLMAHVEGYMELQHESLFSRNEKKRRIADDTLLRYYKRIVTTELLSGVNRDELLKAWDHECKVVKRERRVPEVVDKEHLRILRHIKGYAFVEGVYASCPHCDKTWTSEELIVLYLRRCKNMDDPERPVNSVSTLEKDEDLYPKARLQSTIINYQRNGGVSELETPAEEINALYNHHVSCHVPGCFKCRIKQKKNHVCNANCECRFRLPDCPRTKTVLESIDGLRKWFKWKGNTMERPFLEFAPKHGQYDCFQNSSCKAISESKLACNTNCSLCIEGPTVQYQFKYHLKGNQEIESSGYEEVKQSIQKMDGRRHEDDGKEAVRVVCCAAFAHNKQNVIGPSLASYLIRNDTRFYFSETFNYCPLNDLIRLAHSETVSAIAKYTQTGEVYFENLALHYLCRPPELENISVKDFYDCATRKVTAQFIL